MPRFTTTQHLPALLDLPWSTPLEEWPTDVLASLPRGISRHVVRFVRLDGAFLAVKEINEDIAHREYEMLRLLTRLGIPAVRPVGVVGSRVDAFGEPLDACLVTTHLEFSLPYRALFSQQMRRENLSRAVDALAVLLVRLHLAGFFWGDVSLSNALFRRDAGSFAGYLVDAETGEFHPHVLSNGQREHDLDIARVNVAGEFFDLQAAGLLDEDFDVIDGSEAIFDRYRQLWAELTTSESFEVGERWRVAARVERLNNLGFDVDELDINTDIDGTTVHIQPKVVDAGHHSRRLLRLTGLDAQDGQARRLLNDLDQFRAATAQQNESEELVAHQWLTHVFEPVVRAVPRQLRHKLEAAEVFHEVLEHRWYISEQRRNDVPLTDAVTSYIDTVLVNKPDEQAVLGVDSKSIPVVGRENT